MNLRNDTKFHSLTPVKLAVWLVIGFVLVIAGNFLHAAADPIPTPIRYQIDRARPAKIDILMKRGEWIDLQFQYFDYGQPVDLSSVQALYFVMSFGSITNAYPARIIDSANGMVGFMITPTNLFASNSYTWELPVCGLQSASIRAYGTLTVAPSIGYQGLTNTPPPMQSADFATLVLYNLGFAPWPTYEWITNNVFAGNSTNGNGGGCNVVINGTYNPTLLRIANGSNTTWQLSNGVWRVNVPTVAGPRGEMGLPGTNTVVYYGQAKGDPGSPGTNGYTPIKGVDYFNGRDGTNGLDGHDGYTPIKGIDYFDGEVGPTGATGTSGTAVTNITYQFFFTTNIIQNCSTNIAIAMTISTNLIFSTVTNMTVYNYTSNWISTNILASITNNILGLTNMPAVWDADQIRTNRLYFKMGGGNIGFIDTNGLTLLQGSLTLYNSDLNCNVRLYDGSRTAPSINLAGHPSDSGWYARGYLGNYGFGFEAFSNDIFVCHAGGISMLSSNAAFYGVHAGNAASLTNYPEPIFTNWLANMLVPFVITNASSIALRDANGTNRVTLANDGSMILADGSGTNRVKITTNSLTLADNLKNTRFSITSTSSNTAILWMDTTNVVGIISNNGITLVSTNAYFTGKFSGDGSLMTGYPEPLLLSWRTNPTFFPNSMTLSNSASFTMKDSGGTTRFNVDGSTGVVTVNGTNLTSLYAPINTNYYVGIFTNLDLYGKTNIWKYWNGIVTNRTTL